MLHYLKISPDAIWYARRGFMLLKISIRSWDLLRSCFIIEIGGLHRKTCWGEEIMLEFNNVNIEDPKEKDIHG